MPTDKDNFFLKDLQPCAKAVSSFSNESRTPEALLQECRGLGRCKFRSGSLSSAAKEGRVISTPDVSHVFAMV